MRVQWIAQHGYTINTYTFYVDNNIQDAEQ